MISIYKGESHKLRLEVYKGGSTNLETFSNATYKVLLITNNNRIPLVTEIKDGVLYATVPSGIETGSPDIKVLWIKNADSLRGKGDSRNYNYAEKVNAFAVTNDSSEATSIADNKVICIKMHALTYGYDGLDAYEIGLLRGTWTGSESAWLNSKLGEFVTTDQIAAGAVTTAKLDSTLQGVVAQVAQNKSDITAEVTRAKAAEKVNSDAISAEVTRAKAAENNLLYNTIRSIDITEQQDWDDDVKELARYNIDAASTSVATTSAKGLMSAADKTKLNACVKEAEVYSVLSGGTAVSPSAEKVGVELNDKFNEGYGAFDIPSATTTEAGVMSAADKTKLNTIDSNYVDGAQMSYQDDDDVYEMELTKGGSYRNVVALPNASTSHCGFMSKDDKIKLDGISIENGKLKIVSGGNTYYYDPTSISVSDMGEATPSEGDVYPGDVEEA